MTSDDVWLVKRNTDPGKGFVFKSHLFSFSFVCFFPLHHGRSAVTNTSVLLKKKQQKNKADQTEAGKSGAGGQDEFNSESKQERRPARVTSCPTPF